jgi:hypothetical protein
LTSSLPLCVCFLSFLNKKCNVQPFLYMFSFFPTTILLLFWLVDQSVQFSSVQLICEPGRIKRSGIENPLRIGFFPV